MTPPEIRNLIYELTFPCHKPPARLVVSDLLKLPPKPKLPPRLKVYPDREVPVDWSEFMSDANDRELETFHRKMQEYKYHVKDGQDAKRLQPPRAEEWFLPLFRTCRQLRLEATGILHESTKFEYVVCESDARGSHKWLEVMRPGRSLDLVHLRTVIYNYDLSKDAVTRATTNLLQWLRMYFEDRSGFVRIPVKTDESKYVESVQVLGGIFKTAKMLAIRGVA